MKVISFKLPKVQKDVYHFQSDRLSHFYDKLHQHPEVQITSLLKSTGTLIAGGYIGEFAPGNVFIIGSSLPHVFRNDADYYHNDKKKQAEGLSLYIDTHAWTDSFWAMRDTMPVSNFFRNCYSAYRVKGKLRYFLQTELRRMESLESFERILCMLNILYQIYKSKRSLELISDARSWTFIKENDGMRMSDIIKFSLEESHRTITLNEVARVANMTTEAFCRYFKMHTRKTYISFLNEIRIHHACKLLSNTSLNKAEIAFRSGFNNMSNFNRTFKKIMGKTPGEYLEIIR